MKTVIPNLADDPRVREATERLAELNRQQTEAELHLRDLRSAIHDQPSLAALAGEVAAGVEHDVDDKPLEERISQAARRVDLLAAAVATQSRKVTEVREHVGDGLIQELRPAYGKVLSDVATKVEALCKSMAAHDEFCEAVAAAGLPVSHTLPAGGHWRKPQILRYFGRSITEDHSLAREFFDVLTECGYSPTKPAGKEASRVAVA